METLFNNGWLRLRWYRHQPSAWGYNKHFGVRRLDLGPLEIAWGRGVAPSRIAP